MKYYKIKIKIKMTEDEDKVRSFEGWQLDTREIRANGACPN